MQSGRTYSSVLTRISSSAPVPDFNPGLDFWMVYVSNLTVDLLSALDLVRAVFCLLSYNKLTHATVSHLNCAADNRW